jgi:hypothetical protein
MKNFNYAKVIDNDDNNATDGIIAGRIKIQVPHIHGDTDETLLPWAKPMNLFSGGSGTYGKSSTPEIDSWVWVIFDDDIDFLRPFFIADISLNAMHPHMLFENNIKSKITGWSSSYPDVKYSYYKNGICTAVSSNESNPEAAIYHPAGSYIWMNKNGDIEIKAGSVTTEKSVLGETLKTKIEALIDAINAITVNTPVGVSSVPNNVATFTQIKSALSEILSTTVKNN